MNVLPPVRVLIATTEGPVEVRSLVGAALRSFAICAGDQTTPIKGFSENYHRFVSASGPRGGIARIYGQDFFRIEVSRAIDAGESWQLGVFLAHALRAAGRLADWTAAADTIILATGEVDRCNLSVRAVGAVERKLAKAMPRLEKEVSAGRKLIAMWPLANDEDAFSRRDALQALGITIVPVESVHAALDSLGLELPSAAVLDTRPVWEGTPFRGLDPFEATHRPIFFGRGRAREEVLERLRAAATSGCAFLLLHGASGAGKSSLARAGLFGDVALLTAEADRWMIAAVVPHRGNVAPVQALAAALVEAIPELQLRSGALADAIMERPAGAAAAVTTALAGSRHPLRTKLILLVDQIEQLLLRARNDATAQAHRQRDAFVEILALLARSGVVWVVATMRSDLQTLIEDSPPLMRLVTNGAEYRLGRPTRAELREIVLCPLELAGLTLEGADPSGLPFEHVIVEAAARGPDCLPLLEFALAQLYDKDGLKGKLRYETYEQRIGGLEGAVGRWAEEAIGQLGGAPDTTRALEDVLLRLGRVDRGSGTTVAGTAICDSSFSNPLRERVIGALADARLVIRDLADGRPTARVAHEAVLTHWPRALRLFEANRAEMELRDILEERSRDWKDIGDLIPSGRRLTEAKDILAKGRPELSANARVYIQRSIDKVDKESSAKRRRLLWTTGIAVGLAGLFFVLATTALLLYRGAEIARHETASQRDTAVESQGRLLFARAQDAARSEDEVTATLFALYALEVSSQLGCVFGCNEIWLSDNEKSNNRRFSSSPLESPLDVIDYAQARRRELAVLPVEDAKQFSDGRYYDAAFSADGSLIVTRSGDGRNVRVWDAERYGMLHEFRFQQPAQAILFSPVSGDERLFVAIGSDVEIRDARSGQGLRSLPQKAFIKSIAVSGDGKRLAVASLDDPPTVEQPSKEPVDALKVFKYRPLPKQERRNSSPIEKSAIFSLSKLTVYNLATDDSSSVTVPEVSYVAFDPASGSHRLLVLAGSGEIHYEERLVVNVWDWDHLERAPLVFHQQNGTRSAAFSPNGLSILALSNDNSIDLLDAENGKRLFAYETEHADPGPVSQRKILIAPFSLSSGRAVIPEREGVAILDLQRLNILQTKPIDAPVLSLSPDGLRVALAGIGATTDVWTIDGEGERDLRLMGHDNNVIATKFGPNGQVALTISVDGTARVWRLSPQARIEQETNFGLIGPKWPRQDSAQVIETAKKQVPRCLTRRQLDLAYLAPKPPAWCIEMEKWPYNTPKWKQWLADERTGKNPRVPN